MTETRRFFVSGQVQGVFYRATTQRQAADMGLKGWVRNLPDGRVEVLARGEPVALDELENWLWQGPETASVEDVSAAPAGPHEAATYDEFQVRR